MNAESRHTGPLPLPAQPPLPPQPDRCIACTTCTAVCPVAAATPAFLGPRMAGPAYERFRMTGLDEDASLHYCSNCKNCDISCPCDVPVSTFIMRARAGETALRPPRLGDWILAHGEVLARWLGPIPAPFRNFGMNLSLTRALLHGLGISRHAPLPNFAPSSFRQVFAGLRQPAGLSRTVALFPGCYVNLYAPSCGMDMVAVLNRAGYRVIVPHELICCGLPLIANGFWDDARMNAVKNRRILDEWARQGLPVLTGCPSCGLMVNQDYPDYFPELWPQKDSPERPRLQDACEFLAEALRRGELALPEGRREAALVYHAPCHLRAQGSGLPGLELLREIPGVQVDNADAGCCGIAGSYGFKKDKYALSMHIGEPLFNAVKNHEAGVCVSECGTCRVQIRHGTGKTTLHPITVLRQFLEDPQG